MWRRHSCLCFGLRAEDHMNLKIAISMLLLTAATLHAQPAITSAVVAGTVRDAAGAPIAGANVVASNFERNQKQKTVTDAAGRFRFPVLAVGSYAILIERTGFMSWIGNLRLAVGASVDIPVTLQMAHSVTIEVDGAVSTINTARSEIASNVSP